MNHLFVKISLLVVLCIFSGCEITKLHSMASSPMPVYHEPRWSDDNGKNIAASIDVFGAPYGVGNNVNEVHSIGGDISMQYRIFKPLFIQGAFAGAYGQAKFDCSDAPCTNKYASWLKSNQGKDNYSFWATQEQILVGTDANFSYVQVGLGLGAELMQGGGKYEDMRDELKETHIAGKMNGKYEIYPLIAYWIGVNLGEKARYGIVQIETRTVPLGIADSDLITSSVMGVTYFHPSGFHGGISGSSQMGYMLNFGKTFSF